MTQPSLSDFLGACFFGFLFAGVGVLILRWSLTEIVRSRRSRRWPSVMGRVLSSEVSSNLVKASTNYWPNVRYEYEVEGMSHNNDTIGFGQNGNATLGMASALVAQYPSGQQVKVFYDPNSPKTSCLQTNTLNSGTYVAVFIGVFFIFGALFIGLLGPFIVAAQPK